MRAALVEALTDNLPRYMALYDAYKHMTCVSYDEQPHAAHV